MANRLAGETSPYLLQHAHNPVDWHPWGEEALARARGEDKPIFLSIGYAACHWCHVMERESFEDEATAAQLNADFVPIKVDREERPDLDEIYMAAVVAMTGSGGWPMSIFLTPEGRPFYGGTYFPSVPRGSLPSFRQVLDGVARAWREDRLAVQASSTRLIDALAAQARTPGPTEAATPAVLAAAVAAIERDFDAQNGGWGGAPKFPQAMTIEFLLRRAVSGDDARPFALARRTLDRMADGGIHDQLGGGFHRYSTDARWLVPHFEKMLYDNGQLARVYVHAYQATGDRRYLAVAIDTLDYIERDLATSDGAWAASLDADTDGIEGATFTWSSAEVREELGADAGLFEAAYGVTDGGNWEGRTILSRVRPDEDLADAFGLATDEVARRLRLGRRSLLARRSRRPQPARDDKVLAAWNGLALAAFAEAAVVLERERDPDLVALAGSYRAAARRAGACLLDRMRDPQGRLGRSWKDGRLTGRGVLEDYTHLADGLLALYAATFEDGWFVAARQLIDVAVERFADPAGGFHDTADDHEPLFTRPKDLQDNAIPSGNAMAATVLLTLAALTGEGLYLDRAEAATAQVTGLVARYPTAFGQWLIAIDLALAPLLEVAVVGPPDDAGTRRLVDAARAGFRPHQVIAVAADPAASAVPLLGGRFALNGRATAFVCQRFACRQPVNEPEALAALLADGD